MKLTNEQIQEILDGAPEGATHVEVIEDEPNEYWMLDSDECLWHWHKNPKDPDRTWRIGINELIVENVHDLSDLREILELRQEVERLKAQQSEVAARAVKHGFRCAVALQNNPDVKPLGIDVYANRVANLYVKTMNLFKEQSDE